MGKRYIWPMVALAFISVVTLIIVDIACGQAISESVVKPKGVGTRVIVDTDFCLHTHSCSKFKIYSFVDFNELRESDFDSYCSKCVDYESYMIINSHVGENQKKMESLGR